MALRDQPYFPLYVQDFLTDEKLVECSAESTGVYIRLMCLMHKSEAYGELELKAKYKQNESKLGGFANMLSRQMPYTTEVINRALQELLEEKVITLDGDVLFQKRMKKDGGLSKARAKAGSKGGKSVKNSHTRKLYNEPGFLYVISDIENENTFKIGISKDPRKRLVQLSNKLKKKLEIVFAVETDDMGILEDNVLNEFDESRDGEWIAGIFLEEIKSKIQAIQERNISKTKANTEYENEIENENDSDNEDEIGNDEVFSHAIPSVQETRFDEFWAAYPRKVGKGDARKSWAKLKPSATLHKKILASIADALESVDWQKDEGDFIPHPTTWLNRSGWEDELRKKRDDSFTAGQPGHGGGSDFMEIARRLQNDT